MCLTKCLFYILTKFTSDQSTKVLALINVKLIATMSVTTVNNSIITFWNVLASLKGKNTIPIIPKSYLLASFVLNGKRTLTTRLVW